MDRQSDRRPHKNPLRRNAPLSAKSKWEVWTAKNPSGPAVCDRANRPDTNPQPTRQFRTKNALDPQRASTQFRRACRPVAPRRSPLRRRPATAM
jgi:hypothetical protein